MYKGGWSSSTSQKAIRAREGHAGTRGARALFLTQWVDTGVASPARLHKQGPHLRPRLSLFTKQQKEAESVTESEAPAKGTLHVRTGAALVQSTARQGPAAGWSVTVHAGLSQY